MSLLPTAIQELTMENEMLHAENALKLTQILDLEIILYNTRNKDFDVDSDACWCFGYIREDAHLEHCKAARKATEHLWKSPTS